MLVDTSATLMWIRDYVLNKDLRYSVYTHHYRGCKMQGDDTLAHIRPAPSMLPMQHLGAPPQPRVAIFPATSPARFAATDFNAVGPCREVPVVGDAMAAIRVSRASDDSATGRPIAEGKWLCCDAALTVCTLSLGSVSAQKKSPGIAAALHHWWWHRRKGW